jgi:hypothetical protein
MTASDHQLYVAPWGRDSWPGTHERPFATLAAAQAAVRARPGGTVVNLRAGTYVLTRPFVLNGAAGDSGRPGAPVVYQAYGHGPDGELDGEPAGRAAEEVVISGGRTVTGWRPVPADDPDVPVPGAWRADVGALVTRQLYVDGRPVDRAARQAGIPGTVTRTATGYTTDSTEPQRWADPAGIEFVFRGVNPWTEARCPVAAIEGDERSTVITMAQPAFARARELYAATLAGRPADADQDGIWGTLTVPTSAENSVSFLTEPGTFALDRSRPGEHVLYYLPRPGEDPARAEFVAPVLEELVVGTGTPEHPLHDVTLRGLTFRYAGWTAPSGDGGFLHYHGTTYHDGGPLLTVELADGLARIKVPQRPASVPAAVLFDGASRITLHGNAFSCLGAGAVALTGPGAGNAVTGNTVEDVSGAGIRLDSTGAARVEDNLVRRAGREYHGCPAVWVADCRDVRIAHNEIRDLPYSGIVVMGGDRAARVEVVGNLVERTMGLLADGGGVYLAGRQGHSHADGTVVRGNVIRDTLTPYNFGLYTDFGAAWVTVRDNVVCRADAPLVLRPTPPLEGVSFTGNFLDDHPAGDDDPPPGVTFTGNTVLPRQGFDQALAADPAGARILAAAGRGR